MKTTVAHWMILAALLLAPATTVAEESYPTVKFGGRLQLDYTFFDNDKYQFEDGGEMRRGRLFASGKLGKYWDYKVQYDFAPDDPELKDGYVRYSGFDNARVWFGNFKQPASLEQLTSSKYTTFTERAVANGVAEGRRLGIGYQGWSDKHTWMATAFGDEANGIVEGNGLATRFVFHPKAAAGSVVHLAINGSLADDADDTIRLRARNETHQDSHRILDTGSIENVEDFFRFGTEAAFVQGRFSAQGEYIQLDVRRRNAEDLVFSGYYAFASLFLTDDTRSYSGKDGAFGRVKPTSEKGAWELALRYSTLDLTDKEILGGEGTAITVGVNYYATSHLKFMANYIMADTDEVAGDDDPNAFQLRMQIDF